MNPMKKIRRAFTPRENFVKKFLEEESMIYFNRIEALPDRFSRGYFNQLVISATADAYDFFSYLNFEHNIFYQNAKSINQDTGQIFYALMGMYNTLQYISRQENHDSYQSVRMLESHLFSVFDSSEEKDSSYRKQYYAFKSLCRKSHGEFEVCFARYAAKEIFGCQVVNTVMLAFLNYFFYNSYKGFQAACRLYVSAN